MNHRTSQESGANEFLAPVAEVPTHDPVLNLEREARLAHLLEAPSFRVWRSTSSIVLGRFLQPEREVHTSLAAMHNVPILRRTSGGGAVYHDLGNINYSIYLPENRMAGLSIVESLRLLSFPVIRVLDSLGVDWSWVPPNNVYARGAKISGSAQKRSGNRLLHHGTLLVDTDLDRMRELLRPGGKSHVVPVANLCELHGGISIQQVERMLHGVLSGTEGNAIAV